MAVSSAVPEYWVDAVAETVQVFKFPQGRSYRMVFDHAKGEVAPALEGVPPLGLAAFFAR